MWIALIIVLLIIIWFYIPVPTKDSIICNPEKLYRKSNGTFDGPAQKALDKILKQSAKSAEDHLLAGQIISESILEAETPIVGPRRGITLAAANHFRAGLQVIDRDPANFDTHLIETADNFNHRLDNRLVMDGDLLFPGEIDEFWAVVGGLNQDINQAREVTTQALKQQQKEIQNSSEDAMIGYFEAAKTHTSDNQNSHDPGVSQGIRDSMAIIEKDHSNLPAEMKSDFDASAVKNFIDSADISAEKKNAARQSLSIILKNNEMMTIVGKREIEALKDVWERSYHPGNIDNRENIQLALIDALVDIVQLNGWGQGGVACPSGRVSRIMGSLSTIDFDKNVGNINTNEQIQNFILDNAGVTLTKYFDSQKDGEFAEIVASYKTKDGPPEGPLLDKFRAGLREKIDEMLIENNATPTMKEKVFAGLDL